MRYYFDTSAVNAAHKDPLGPTGVLRALGTGSEIFVSSLNIVEVGSTADPRVRVDLMDTLKTLANGVRPAIFPNDALKRSLDTIVANKREMDWSISMAEDGLWVALQQPELMADQNAVDELREYKQEQEDWWRSMHEGARPRLQTIAEQEGDIFGSPLRLVRYYGNHDAFIADLFDDLLGSIGYPQFQGKAKRLLQEVEPWTFYFGAMAYGSYSRAVQQSNYGHKKNPGGLDSQQAVYLACCDTFVTRDYAQRGMLKGLRIFGQRLRKVISYEAFRASLTRPCA